MRELNFINTWLGGHSITIRGFEKLINKKNKISVCEIGCGGGDNLNAVYNFCKKKNIQVNLEGIDINPDCIAFAKRNSVIENINFIISDYKDISFTEQKPCIIFSSLFCHHFTDDELVCMLQWMKQNATVGFFINDLHRHPLAYNFIRASTQLFSKSYLVKNDAPLSVLKGFRKKEWQELFQKAGITNYSIEWKWAFRHLIVCQPLQVGVKQN
ncbi:MAG: methyltransferase domain-containing protein, partial [Chitinophagaceae bacterium]